MNVISNGTNCLKDVIAKAENKYIDPNLDKIENALESIKHDFGNEDDNNAVRRKIESAVDNLAEAKDAMFYIKENLDLLANITINNADRVLNAIDRFEAGIKKRKCKCCEMKFQNIVTEMKLLLDESEEYFK